MKISRLFLALVLLFPSLIFADDVLVIVDNRIVKAQAVIAPKLNIGGLDGAELNDMTILSATLVPDAAQAFVKSVSVKWTILLDGKPRPIFVNDVNNTAVCVLKSGVTVVQCKGTVVYAVGTESLSKEVLAEQSISLVPPKPPEPPKPPPVPTPVVVPDGFLGYQKLAYISYNPIVFEKRAKVAQELSTGYLGIVAKINAGGYSQFTNGDDWIKQLMLDIKNVRISTLASNGVDKDLLQAFTKTLSDKIFAQYSDGTLKSTTDYSNIFTSISDGLKLIQ